MSNIEILKESLIEGYNDVQLNKPCKDWFGSYNEKCAYLLGRSMGVDKGVITEEVILKLISKL